MSRNANLIENTGEIFPIPVGTHMVKIRNIALNTMVFQYTPQSIISTYSSSDGYAAKKLKSLLRVFGREAARNASLEQLHELCQEHIGLVTYIVVRQNDQYPDVMDFDYIDRVLI